MHGPITIFVVLLVLAWIGGAIWFFMGPARAADRYVNELAASVTRRDDALLFRQLYRNKQPRNVVVAWVLTSFLSPTISYVYTRQWVRCLLSVLTLEGFGIWWLISIFSMPFEVMNINKRLADAAYADLRLARPELFSGAGDLAPRSPQGLNPQSLRQAGYLPHSEGPLPR